MVKSGLVLIFLFQLFISAEMFGQQQDTIVLKEGLLIKLQDIGSKIISPDIISGSIETGKWNSLD
jgi:hypothetical protein